MKKTFSVLIVLLFVCIQVNAQKNKEEQEIVDEGRKLYESETASWKGTDLFLARYPDELQHIGGYFSYADNKTVKCIFFSHTEEPKVIASVIFDKTFDTDKAKVDRKERPFTSTERNIYLIRKLALADINTDTLFKTFKHTNFNLIPLVEGDQRKVYVLTGPEMGGVVIFGNDYLLTFDKRNKLRSKKQLHRNLIPIEYGDSNVVSTIHSHLPETGELITATDICTLMLYENMAKWESHIVMGPETVSIWNCKTNSLAVIPRKDFENGFKKE